MATTSSTAAITGWYTSPSFSRNIRTCNGVISTRRFFTTDVRRRTPASITAVNASAGERSELQYRKLGDSDLIISEITLGTMTFGEQNTEKEAHDILNYSFEQGINILDTAEAYPVPMKKETQGRTDLYIGSWLKTKPRDKVIIATKVCGYSERSGYIRDNPKVLRVDAANIKESVEKSLKRLNTDYIDLLQIHWYNFLICIVRKKISAFKFLPFMTPIPFDGILIKEKFYFLRPDRYVAIFGEFTYDFNKWRSGVPFEDQLKALQEVIDEGKVRYIGVSNETSYGVMEFVHAAKLAGLPKIVSIQNCYNLITRCKFEVDLVEVCHPNNYNIGLLAYSPLGGGNLTGKYLDPKSDASKKGRFNLFPGYMERYNSSYAKEVTTKYVELGKKHGLSPVELALGFVRDRPFVTSSIIGATSVNQLKEDIDAFLTSPRPFPPELMQEIELIFKRNKDPAID